MNCPVRSQEAHATDERQHRKPLNKDRESHDGESSDGDLFSFGNGTRQSKSEDQPECSTQTAPHEDMLITSVTAKRDPLKIGQSR